MTDTLDVRSSAQDVLAPRSVVVVGASATRPDATGNHVLRNLASTQFTGRLEVVNPSGGVIEGVVARTSILDVEPADLVVVAVAPRAVQGVLEGAHQAGVSTALVMSVGLDSDQLSAIAAFSRASGMRVHGPNCMGVINVSDAITLWADEGNLAGLIRGSVGLISQSGSGAIFVARSMSGVGFSHVVSTGNEVSMTTSDYIDFLVGDAETSVIGIIVESIGHADSFAAATRRARAAGKPVVALKVGRSRAGALATVAHTGAILTDDAIVAAFFDRIGVPLVKDYDELASTLEVLAHLQGRSLGDGRIAAVTISGGQCALTADLAADVGASLAEISEGTRARLAALLPGASINNPLDAGGSESAGELWYSGSLEALASDPAVDVVLAVIDSQASLNATEIDYEDEMIAEVHLAARRLDVPFVVASSSSLSIHPTRISAINDPFTVVRGIRNALVAIVAATTATADLEGSAERPADLPDAETVSAWRSELSRPGGGRDARGLLEVYGIPLAPSAVVQSVEDAVVWAEQVGYPIVLKIESPDVAHRSDIGGVALGIEDAMELQTAWDQVMSAVTFHRPDARVAGMQIQKQLSADIEAIVGAVDSPVGATVGIGLGGVLVELLGDTAHALAPLTVERARQTLRSTRLYELLNGYRNIRPVIDATSLVDVVVRLSWLIADFHGVVAEVELNPVLIDPDSGQCSAADLLVVARAELSGSEEPR